MVIVVCSVATGAPRVRLVVAGHSRTMAYTASALDVYLSNKGEAELWSLTSLKHGENVLQQGTMKGKECKEQGRLNNWKSYRE